MVYTLGLNKKIAMKSLKLLSDDLFQSRMQVSSNSSVKKSLSREDALNRLSRKFENSENMQQSDDYKHDGFS